MMRRVIAAWLSRPTRHDLVGSPRRRVWSDQTRQDRLI